MANGASTISTPKLAETLEEYAANPESYESIRDVPAGIAVRLPGFADLGIDGATLVEAVREAGPQVGPATAGWAAKIAHRGDVLMSRGELAVAAGNRARAREEFLGASFWYFFARFPHIVNPEGAAAYRRHVEAYTRAAAYFDGSFEVLTIPFESSHLMAYLRLPAERTHERVPAVVVWGGIDVWKSDLELNSQGRSDPQTRDRDVVDRFSRHR